MNLHHPTLPHEGMLEEEVLTDGVLLEGSANGIVDRKDLKLANIAPNEKKLNEPTVTTSELPYHNDTEAPFPSNLQRSSVVSTSFADFNINTGDFATNIDIEAHRPSNASTLFPPPGIYRRTQVLMLLSLLIGICCFILLHIWYTLLNGKRVGDVFKQQQALRVGNVLAVCASASYIFAIQKSYEQVVWRELKTHNVSFQGLDKACTTSKDLTSFFNKEIWRTTRRSNVLAFLCYLIPIAALFAPATLNTRTEMQDTLRSMKVPMLDIAQAVQYASYAYAVTRTLLSEKFLGPRTIITRWVVATASAGEVPNLPSPAANASYTQNFWAPYVHCDSSTPWVILQTDDMLDRFRESQAPSSELIQIDYFSAVPALGDFTNGTETVQVANLTDADDATSASNELWIYTSQYRASLDFSQPIQKVYLTCRLYNASYITRFTWVNGEQDLQVLNITKHKPVVYPANASTLPESEASMAYSALMWALSTQVTGSIAFYKDLNATGNTTQVTYANRIYGEIATNVANTVLIGACKEPLTHTFHHFLGAICPGLG